MSFLWGIYPCSVEYKLGYENYNLGRTAKDIMDWSVNAKCGLMTGILKEKKIAYFSMEIGLLNDIPTYAGGLGTLAGDTIKSSADLNLPFDCSHTH